VTLLQDTCLNHRLALPNKLFEYTAAGVPVLASDMPVLAKVVRAARIGEVVSADDPVAIAAGLRLLTEPAGVAERTRRARAFAHTNSWSSEAQILARVYTDLAAPHDVRATAVAMRCA